jgi:hypothetical protein
MSFVKFLQGIGDRLGILETAPAGGSPAAVRIQTRSVSLQELTGEIKSGAVQSLADAPAELAVSFERIFEAAGISANPQDWTTDRLKQVLADAPCKDKPREEAQKAVLALLNSAGISPEIIVKDAMARDRALDAYEIFVRDKMQCRMAMHKKKLAAAESRIRDLQEECRTLEKTMKEDEEKWNEWKRNKRARERELASIVSYIVDHKVITLDEQET